MSQRPAMKRILFASWYTGLGGGETDLLWLREALHQAGWDAQLLLPAAGALSERWRDAGSITHILPFRGATTLFLPAIWARFPIVSRFEALLRSQQIDLVHSDYHSLPMIAPAASRAGLPLVFTLHGWWFKPKPWQRDFFRRIPAIVARSQAIRAGFLGTPPFMPAADLPVIYSGVDSSRFQPGMDDGGIRAALGIPRSTPVVGMVARFQRVKGHHRFQALAADIARDKPEAQFIVAGDDAFGVPADRRYRDQMLAAAARHPSLRDRLHYIGFRDDIERVYAAVDALVCASDFESYGKANLEAMACGVPVISSNRGGPNETLAHGETGFLVDPDDQPGMTRYALDLLNDAELRARMGAAGRAHVLRRFSLAASAAAYMQVFKRLLAIN